jgi:hypothetical protein
MPSDPSDSRRPSPERAELPLPDYDHLPLAAVIQRIRSLPAAAIEDTLAYEESHGNRLPVTEALRTRLAELADGAEPSAGSQQGPFPEAGAAPANPRSIDQSTDAPTVNPPSHGDPTNPAQPR